MQDIKNLTLKELESYLLEWRYPAYHARQIFSWVYQRKINDFLQMSDLSLDLRKELKDKFSIQSLKLIAKRRSLDDTEKLLLELNDKNLIEAVLIPVSGRVTGCLSSQVGCRFKCSFCASGISGFKRNLDTAEIVEEALILKEAAGDKLTHLVFMGTGEPLDNYDNVLRAVRIINSKDSLNIGARRITISTCGIIPGIKRLVQENLQLELSVSLHAADNELRSKVIPVNKKYPLKELIKTCKEYSVKTDRQVTFEYSLIKGINSDLQNAKNLSKILKGFRLSKVNLILANPVKELGVMPISKKELDSFKNCLLADKINVTVRASRGEDIEAACGQLRLRYEKS